MIGSAARWVEPIAFPDYLGARRVPDRGVTRGRDASTLYGRAGCHLCDDARERARARPRPRAVRARRGRHHDRRRPPPPLPRADPGRLPRRRASCSTSSWTRRRSSKLYRWRPMSFGDVATRGQGDSEALGPLSDRLSLGVAARLSRYLQVLTQARKMGKETISSQELSEYTHVNSTQIRRDLSGFGKFGKRGVGYNVDSLVSQIRKILRTSRPAQHRAVRRRPPRQGDRLLGHLRRPRLPRRRDLRRRRGQDRRAGRARHGPPSRRACARSSRRRTSSSASSPCPTAAAQELADQLVDAGVKIIFNYSEALLHVPPEVTVHTSQPGRRPPLRALLLPDVAPRDRPRRRARDLRGARRTAPSASRRSSRSSTPRRSSSSRASRRCATPPRPTRCSPSRSPAS